MRLSCIVLMQLGLLSVSSAHPTHFDSHDHDALRPRGDIASNAGADLLTTLSSVATDVTLLGAPIAQQAAALTTNLSSIISSNAPGAPSVEKTLQTLQSIFSTSNNPGHATDIVTAAQDILASGLLSGDIARFLNGYTDSALNAVDNQNRPLPTNHSAIYPFKALGDAPFSLTETQLRSAIHIPSTFAYGANGKKPVILVPGTACPAGTTYYYSFSKLDQAISSADIVWINVPDASLGDAQVTSEYVAYAINYISAVSGDVPVSIISWSQGGLNTQWALKYWPSTRTVLEDFIAISPDFHGTIEQAFLCPQSLLPTLLGSGSLASSGLDINLNSVLGPACTPSINQQGYNAQFITTLRSDGGDSAYVPTTIIYSDFDEIVQPQIGPNPSSYLGDVRGVGVTVNNLQSSICAGQVAGGFYTHEGVLYNPLAWALAVDALENSGPGTQERVLRLKGEKEVCGRLIPEQLTLEDVLGTEGVLVLAVAEILAYAAKTGREPVIASYAR